MGQDILTGGTAGGTTTIDDSTQGSGQNQFNYVGSWGHCTQAGCGTDSTYNNSNSWSTTTNDSVTVAFTGTQIKFYGVTDSAHGEAAVSIDGGSETTVDLYASSRQGNVLLWTSPTLAAGSHTFKVRVTGRKNASSSDYYVAVDRVDILS